MHLQPYVKSSHISVFPTTQLDSATPPSETARSICYTVEGVSVGSTYLLFNATSSDGTVVSSKPNEIQVFAPLKLSPDSITLLPSAVFQVITRGNPLCPSYGF